MASSSEINAMFAGVMHAENDRYHTLVHAALSSDPDIAQLKRDLVAEISRPKDDYVDWSTIDIRYDLGLLFHSESPVNFTFKAALPPIPSKTHGSVCEPYKVWPVQLHRGAVHGRKCDHDDALIAFETYFFTADPDVARIRNILKAAFPSAKMYPRLEIGDERSSLVISLVFTPPPVDTLVALECAEYPTWNRGDPVRW